MPSYTTPQVVALKADQVNFVRLLEIVLPQNTLRYNDSAVDIQLLGETWFGAGDLLSMSLPAQDLTLAANTATFDIAGVTSAVASLALRTPMAGRKVRVLHALFDDQWQPIGDPVVIFRGRVSHLTLTNEGSGGDGG